MRIVFPVVFMIAFSLGDSRMVYPVWEVGTQKIYTYPKESEEIYEETGGDGEEKGQGDEVEGCQARASG
jgi:hypothetical protein